MPFKKDITPQAFVTATCNAMAGTSHPSFLRPDGRYHQQVSAILRDINPRGWESGITDMQDIAGLHKVLRQRTQILQGSQDTEDQSKAELLRYFADKVMEAGKALGMRDEEFSKYRQSDVNRVLSGMASDIKTIDYECLTTAYGQTDRTRGTFDGGVAGDMTPESRRIRPVAIRPKPKPAPAAAPRADSKAFENAWKDVVEFSQWSDLEDGFALIGGIARTPQAALALPPKEFQKALAGAYDMSRWTGLEMEAGPYLDRLEETYAEYQQQRNAAGRKKD